MLGSVNNRTPGFLKLPVVSTRVWSLVGSLQWVIRQIGEVYGEYQSSVNWEINTKRCMLESGAAYDEV